MADKGSSTVTLTQEQFDQLLAAARGGSSAQEVAVAVAREFQKPQIGTAEERFEAFRKELKPEPAPSEMAEILVDCRSHVTKATFRARVVASRTFPAGRIVELVDYKRPSGWDVPKSSGGLVPDGMTILKDNANPSDMNPEKYTPQFLDWAWGTFWKVDLVEYVGKALPPYIRLDIADKMAALAAAATPVQMPSVG